MRKGRPWHERFTTPRKTLRAASAANAPAAPPSSPSKLSAAPPYQAVKHRTAGNQCRS